MFAKTRIALLLASVVSTAAVGCGSEASEDASVGEGAMMASEQPPQDMEHLLASGFVSAANLKDLIDPTSGIYVLDNPGVMMVVDHYGAQDFQRADGSAGVLKQLLGDGIRVPKSAQIALKATPRFDCEKEAYVTSDGAEQQLPPSATTGAFLTQLSAPSSPVSSVMKRVAEVEGTPIVPAELEKVRKAEQRIFFTVLVPSKNLKLYFGSATASDAWILYAVDISTPCSG